MIFHFLLAALSMIFLSYYPSVLGSMIFHFLSPLPPSPSLL
jgi:hypothetical protein